MLTSHSDRLIHKKETVGFFWKDIRIPFTAIATTSMASPAVASIAIASIAIAIVPKTAVSNAADKNELSPQFWISSASLLKFKIAVVLELSKNNKKRNTLFSKNLKKKERPFP